MAPMAGITDAPMRRIIHEKCGKKVFLTTEMAAVNAISMKNPKTYKIIDVREEPYPVAVQLVGADPDLFRRAAQNAEYLGAKSIDINMGCPVKKIISGGAGSALMKDIKKASEIIKATVASVSLPVSVKFRKGWDESSVNAVDFAKMCEDSGACFITVHGRTRAQGYAGTADWQIIRDVKANVKIPVIGNGDITSAQKAKDMILTTGVDGVMIARAALGNPWLLSDTYDLLHQANQNTIVDIAEIEQTVLAHMNLLKTFYGERLALALSRKHICWYTKRLYDAKRFRENYMKISDFNIALEEIKQYFKDQTKE